MNQLQYKYKLIKGGDNNLYVSIQPLMTDINNSIIMLCKNTDTSKLNDQERQIFDLKLLGLKTVYEFLGSLLTEQLLKDEQQKYSGNIPLNVDNNFTLTNESTKVH